MLETEHNQIHCPSDTQLLKTQASETNWCLDVLSKPYVVKGEAFQKWLDLGCVMLGLCVVQTLRVCDYYISPQTGLAQFWVWIIPLKRRVVWKE